MNKQAPSRLKRPRYVMPAFVRKALVQSGLMPAYKNRPPYQQNDYIGWITRAKLKETQEKRLAQMLDELERATGRSILPKNDHSRRLTRIAKCLSSPCNLFQSVILFFNAFIAEGAKLLQWTVYN